MLTFPLLSMHVGADAAFYIFISKLNSLPTKSSYLPSSSIIAAMAASLGKGAQLPKKVGGDRMDTC